MDYEKLNRIKQTQLAALTRAKRSDDPAKVIAACQGARLAFDQHGWPDQWPTWAVAVRDLEYHDDDAIRAAAQAEAEAWG